MREKEKSKTHLAFCVAMYREQHRQGRHFVHEHPQTSDEWKVPFDEYLAKEYWVYLAQAEMCQFGTTSRDKDGEGDTKKPTTFMRNYREMFRTLNRKCKDAHRHVLLVGGRAQAAAIYPRDLLQSYT